MMSMLLPGESLVQKKAFLLSAPAGGAPGAAQRACWLFFLAGSIRGQSRALAMLCILLLVMVGARVGGATLQLLQLLSLLWISFILYREGHWVACCHTSLGSATLQLLQLLRLQLSLQSVMALAEGCVPIPICIFTVL